MGANSQLLSSVSVSINLDQLGQTPKTFHLIIVMSNRGHNMAKILVIITDHLAQLYIPSSSNATTGSGVLGFHQTLQFLGGPKNYRYIELNMRSELKFKFHVS